MNSMNETDDLNATLNIVHPEWEMIDPVPDIFALFTAFDNRFFQGKLKCVTLEWSKRMYSCAGICYSRKNRIGSECTIRLSEPLLKLRSRKDLIQTLLHEMIHAFLFVQNIREANGGHGPLFKQKMNQINKVAGTNITVYHNFYDEVAVYKTHVWRCNGICQHRSPFYGYVKRTTNRAPGPNDLWWKLHETSCGGYFQKVSEPEPKQTKNDVKSTKKQCNNNNSIKTYFPASNSTVTTGGNLSNVIGFNDLTSPPKKTTNSTNVISTVGKTLGGKSGTGKDRLIEDVRNAWSNKYLTNSSDNSVEPTTSSKSITKRQSLWKEIDDEIQIKEVTNEIIDITNDDEDSKMNSNINKRLNSKETSARIKSEFSEDTDYDSSIELIDDEFDDELLNETNEVLNTAVLYDIFGNDTLLEDYENINKVIMKDPENYDNPNNEIITCPICVERMSRHLLNEHLDGCGGIRQKINPSSSTSCMEQPQSHLNRNQRKVSNKRKHSDTDDIPRRNNTKSNRYSGLERQLALDEDEEEYNNRIMRELAEESIIYSPDSSDIEDVEMVSCPNCPQMVKSIYINEHLDICLTK